MIDRNHRLALTKQAALLGLSRGSVYYEPVPVSDTDLALMRRLDELHLEFPFAGARMLRGLLAAEGSKIGRRHVTTLMRRVGIEAIYRKPNTSKPAPGHRTSGHDTEKFTTSACHLAVASRSTSSTSEDEAVKVLAFLSASMLSSRPLQNTAARKSSTPIRAASSPVPNSPAC